MPLKWLITILVGQNLTYILWDVSIFYESPEEIQGWIHSLSIDTVFDNDNQVIASLLKWCSAMTQVKASKRPDMQEVVKNIADLNNSEGAESQNLLFCAGCLPGTSMPTLITTPPFSQSNGSKSGLISTSVLFSGGIFDGLPKFFSSLALHPTSFPFSIATTKATIHNDSVLENQLVEVQPLKPSLSPMSTAFVRQSIADHRKVDITNTAEGDSLEHRLTTEVKVEPKEHRASALQAQIRKIQAGKDYRLSLTA